ncbi:MAG: hypothetical protein DMG13_04380 [Acidobacteria bacterium]|nr:MAG: hypothetical protein DMG13_04380 [Acidobacteriota bacterium]
MMKTMSRFATITAVLLLLSITAHTQWQNYPRPGIPRLSDGKPDLKAPTPRMADGKPDLSGVWDDRCYSAECAQSGPAVGQRRVWFFDLAQGLKASDVEMTPWAAAIQSQRVSRDHVDDPYGYCMLPGVPRINFIGTFKIIPTPQVTVFLYETAANLAFRQVFTDGRPLPEVTEHTWLGYSMGKWEGDTFVVETTGLKDGGWLDTDKARPHSDALRVTERFRRTDFGHIELTITIDDPKAYLKPWTVKTALNLVPDTELLEGSCDNHEKTMEHRRIPPAPPEPPSPGPH